MVPDNFKKIALISFAGLALALTAAALVWAYQAMTYPAGRTLSTVVVSGQAKETYAPDLADIDFALISKGTDPAAVQSQNNAKMAAVIEQIKKQGVSEEDIKTVSYNLYPEYKQGPNVTDTSVIVGYTLQQGVRVRVRDISQTGTIVGSLSSMGINAVNNISFSLSDGKMDALVVKAKQGAIQKAQQQLATMKTLLGFRSARLVGVSDSGYPYPVYERSYKALGAAGGGSGIPAPIEAGTGEITVPVTLTYEIR